MKKALIITWESFQDHELVYPYYRLLEDEFTVDIMSNKIGRIYGILGTNMPSTKLVSDLQDEQKFQEYLNQYDILVLPGGVKSLEKLRQEKTVLKFINDWNASGKVISSTCHGAQLLISAKVVKGRKISGYYSLEDDINNSGAIYVNEPYVIDSNIISSPHYDHMGIWMKKTLDCYYEKLQ
jgi:protease I